MVKRDGRSIVAPIEKQSEGTKLPESQIRSKKLTKKLLARRHKLLLKQLQVLLKMRKNIQNHVAKRKKEDSDAKVTKKQM